MRDHLYCTPFLSPVFSRLLGLDHHVITSVGPIGVADLIIRLGVTLDLRGREVLVPNEGFFIHCTSSDRASPCRLHGVHWDSLTLTILTSIDPSTLATPLS